MAKLILHRPLTLGGINYPAGKNEVPDDHCTGWFYDALVKSCDIVIAGSESSFGETELRAQVEALKMKVSELEDENEVLKSAVSDTKETEKEAEKETEKKSRS